MFGVFKCMTNNTENKQKNVFDAGIPLTCATLVTNGDSCCVFHFGLFVFFSLAQSQALCEVKCPR